MVDRKSEIMFNLEEALCTKLQEQQEILEEHYEDIFEIIQKYSNRIEVLESENEGLRKQIEIMEEVLRQYKKENKQLDGKLWETLHSEKKPQYDLYAIYKKSNNG